MPDPADPFRPQVRTPPPPEAWYAPSGGPIVHSPARPGPMATTACRGWPIGVVAAALVIALHFATRASPPHTPDIVAAPAWNVELTSAGRRPVMALVYGEEAGLHLVQVPSVSAGQSERRVIPARLARGELYMVSLGWSPLAVRASSPSGARPAAWSAQARFVRAFQNERGTGVMTLWP